MICERRQTLSSYTARLQSGGRLVFSDADAVQALGVTRGAFLDAAERLQRRQSLIRPRRGFYVVVPAQYAAWGAPPANWYIDELMRHEGRPYYVGLLKAAEWHGATHHAVMEFQIVTDKRLPDIRAGRDRIAFYYRKNIEAVLDGIEERQTHTGRMMLSSVELTALDIVRYVHAGGGIDHVATVLADLAPGLRPKQLAALSAAVERPVAQRLGCLLDQLGHEGRTGPLFDELSSKGVFPWVELDNGETRHPEFVPPPRWRDKRWRVIVRRTPEADE